MQGSLAQADALIVFISKASLAAGRVKPELAYAKSGEVQGSLKICLVLLEKLRLPIFLESPEDADLFSGGLVSIVASLLESLSGEGSLYDFERQLRRFAGKKFDLAARSLKARKQEAVSVVKAQAENKFRQVNYSTLALTGGSHATDVSQLVKWIPRLTRDFIQYRLMSAIAATLENRSESLYSRSVTLDSVIDEIYRMAHALLHEYGLAATAETDIWLAGDVKRVLTLLSGGDY
jgi:hypothetical protein